MRAKKIILSIVGVTLLVAGIAAALYFFLPWRLQSPTPPAPPAESGTPPAAAPAADTCEAQGIEYVLIDGVPYDPNTSTELDCVPAPAAQAGSGETLEGLLSEGEQAGEGTPSGEAGTLEDLLTQSEETATPAPEGTPQENQGTPSGFWKWGWAIPLGLGLVAWGAGFYLRRRYVPTRTRTSRRRDASDGW